ncbi:MAG: hypothetical protein Q7S00_06955 [bacterium]|nr:hypothetical protein [bacterium]
MIGIAVVTPWVTQEKINPGGLVLGIMSGIMFFVMGFLFDTKGV